MAVNRRNPVTGNDRALKKASLSDCNAKNTASAINLQHWRVNFLSARCLVPTSHARLLGELAFNDLEAAR